MIYFSEANNQGGNHIRQQSDPTSQMLQPRSRQAVHPQTIQLLQAHAHAHAPRPKMKTNGHFTGRMRSHATEGPIQEEDEMLENAIPNRPSMGTQVHGRPSKGIINSKSVDNSLLMASSGDQQEVTSPQELGRSMFSSHLKIIVFFFIWFKPGSSHSLGMNLASLQLVIPTAGIFVLCIYEPEVIGATCM